MEYVNKLIIQGNTYEIQDKYARTQLSSIASEVSNNANSLNEIREDIDVISEVTASSLTDIDTRLNKIEEILAYISYISLSKYKQSNKYLFFCYVIIFNQNICKINMISNTGNVTLDQSLNEISNFVQRVHYSL